MFRVRCSLKSNLLVILSRSPQKGTYPDVVGGWEAEPHVMARHRSAPTLPLTSPLSNHQSNLSDKGFAEKETYSGAILPSGNVSGPSRNQSVILSSAWNAWYTADNASTHCHRKVYHELGSCPSLSFSEVQAQSRAFDVALRFRRLEKWLGWDDFFRYRSITFDNFSFFL